MAIVVKHEGNAGAYAAGAYEGGSGKRRAQDRAQASQAVASEMAQSRQAAHASRDRQIAGLGDSRGRRGREDATGLTKRGVRPPIRRIESDQIGRGPIREGSIESNQIGRRTTVGQQGAGALSEENQEYLEKKKLDSMFDLETRRRDKEEYDYDQQMQRSKYDYQQQMQRGMYDYQQRMDRDKFEYQYTSKQKEEVDKLNNLYETAKNSQMFTDEELPEIKRQIFKKIAGIEKMPTLKNEEQTPLERAQASMFTDPETGRRGYINKDGEPQFFKSETESKNSNEVKRPEFDRRYREIQQALTKPKMVQDEGTGVEYQDGEIPPEPEEVLAALREQDEVFKAYQLEVQAKQEAEERNLRYNEQAQVEAEAYRKRLESERAQAPVQEAIAPSASTEEQAPPRSKGKQKSQEAPKAREDGTPTDEVISKAGQDPKRVGGYTSIKLSNGKYIPNTLNPFIKEEDDGLLSLDMDVVEEYVSRRVEKPGNKLDRSEIIATISREWAELVSSGNE